MYKLKFHGSFQESSSFETWKFGRTFDAVFWKFTGSLSLDTSQFNGRVHKSTMTNF